jgi:shikimate 5-dehydrogenase
MAAKQVLLAKALKVKNRQIQKVRELQQRINACNSYLDGAEPDFDANALYQELEIETARLWKTKAAINAANAPIQPVIYELAEAKGQVTFLKGLNTQRGLQMLAYLATQPQEYVSQITAQEAANRVAAIEKRIDTLQDQLDEHNATTLLEVEIDD